MRRGFTPRSTYKANCRRSIKISAAGALPPDGERYNPCQIRQ